LGRQEIDMRLRKIFTVLLVISMVGLLTSCGTIPEEHKGAAVGAGLGAAAGILLGGDTEGRIIGGLIGALVGGAIGHYAYDQRRTRQETAGAYNYHSSQGTVLTLEDAGASPDKVKGGGIVHLAMTYALLTPSQETETSVTEIREITHDGKLVGRPQTTVARRDGTYTSDIPLHLPKDAEKGVYHVMATVRSAKAQDTREFTFNVS
jgi:hypothetical protein